MSSVNLKSTMTGPSVAQYRKTKKASNRLWLLALLGVAFAIAATAVWVRVDYIARMGGQ